MTAHEDQAQQVIAVLRALPPRQRQVLALTIDGWSPAEISELLGIGPAAVRSNLMKARRSAGEHPPHHRRGGGPVTGTPAHGPEPVEDWLATRHRDLCDGLSRFLDPDTGLRETTMFTVLAALSGTEREYIRDRTLEGHESARTRGKSIGGAAVTDDAMLAVALHLRGQELSLRDIAARLVIATGKKKGQHPSPATVMRMLREHDEKAGLASGLRTRLRSSEQATPKTHSYFAAPQAAASARPSNAHNRCSAISD